MVRRYAPWVISVLLTLITATTALAVGSMGPYTATNWGAGRDSPNWLNQSGDDRATVSAKSCRDNLSNGSNDWIKVTVYREAGIFPDENLGTKQINCYGSTYASKTWVSGTDGNLTGPETFHFTLTDYSGGTGGGNVMDFTYKVSWQ